MQQGEVAGILRVLGEDPTSRDLFIACLKAIEAQGSLPGDVRNTLTGPLVDALLAGDQPLTRSLANGLVFNFRYTSRISREFIMSTPDTPNHVWEPQTTKLLAYLAALSGRDAIVGGAYFGDHAIIIADELRRAGGTPVGVCHAFEPTARQAESLLLNATTNALDNLRVKSFALWDESGHTLSFAGTEDDSLEHSVEVGAGQGCQTITIDDYVAEQGIVGRLGLIMLDIEGSELRVLQGATKQLAQGAETAPNIVFEIHRRYMDWSDGLHNTEIVRFLNSFGYTIYSVRDYHANIDTTGEPIELIKPEETYLEGPPHGFNMLAVRDTSILQNSQFRFVSGVSPKLFMNRDSQLFRPVND